MTVRKRWCLVRTTAALCLAAGSAYPQKPAASTTGIAEPAGFHIVLLRADSKPGRTVEELPAGVMKALKDASEFLPYKSYALQDGVLVRGARPSSDPQAVRLQGPDGREYVANIRCGPTYPAAEQSWFVSLNVVDLSDREILRTGFDIRLGETVVVGTSKVKVTDQALVLLVTALSPKALAAYAQEPLAAKKPTPIATAPKFSPPLSIRKERRYDRDFASVEAAVRDAMKSLRYELLKEQKVESRSFEAVFRPDGAGTDRARSARYLPGRDSVRIVLEPVSEKRTAVRVFYAAATVFDPGPWAYSKADGIFRMIEARLPR